MIKRVWKKVTDWYREDPDEKAEDEEFDKFLEKVTKRIDKIDLARKASTHSERVQVCMMVDNAYTQRKMVEANNSLKAATWVLAIATIALTINSAYGAVELNNVVRVSLQLILGIILIGLTLYVLKGFWSICKFLFSLIGKRKR